MNAHYFTPKNIIWREKVSRNKIDFLRQKIEVFCKKKDFVFAKNYNKFYANFYCFAKK